jgi:hypothetical protein
VVDVYAARAHLGSDVAAADRAFDIMQVTLFFEETGDGSLAAWSLGPQVRSPDIVVLGVAPDAATDAALLRDVANTLAPGERSARRRGRRARRPALCSPGAFGPASAAAALEGDAIARR